MAAEAVAVIVVGMTTSQRIDATFTSAFTTGRNRYLAPAKKGWYSDPKGQHQFRYHDGQCWTDHTTHFGPSPCNGCHS